MHATGEIFDLSERERDSAIQSEQSPSGTSISFFLNTRDDGKVGKVMESNLFLIENHFLTHA